MAREDAQVRIRLPHDIKGWLKFRSKQNLRTQNAELVMLLREKMERELNVATGRTA